MFKSILASIRNWFRAEAERMRQVRREIARDEALMRQAALQRAVSSRKLAA